MGWTNSSVLLQNQSLHWLYTNTVCCQKSGIFNNVTLIMDQLEPPDKLDYLLIWQENLEKLDIKVKMYYVAIKRVSFQLFLQAVVVVVVVLG